jgi:ABC-2 type transport system ATP-binding protein
LRTKPLVNQTTDTDLACEVLGLSKRFGDRDALTDVHFAIERGAIFGLLGPNGGGKTTLFRILSTLLQPDSGAARVAGLDVTKEPARVRRAIGVVFQNPSLDKKLTVRENLRCQGALYGITGAELGQRIDGLLDQLSLADRHNDLVETLSGGLQRRADLARGLLHGPSVLLLDEPSTGLDPVARRELWEHLDGLRKDAGTTVLLTTHILEEADGCDQVAILDRGKLVAAGTPDALKAEIGADVITNTADDAAAVAKVLKERFNAEPTISEGRVRLEREEGHAFIPQLFQAFPDGIREVTLKQPTLEDVFFRRTGHRFEVAESEDAQ